MKKDHFEDSMENQITKEENDMLPQIEPMLYPDPQKEKMFFFCSFCGGECYAPSFYCPRCERSVL